MKRIALKLAHVGINPDSPEEMKKMRFFLHDVLGMEETMETPVSWFGMDGKAELMKQEGRGRKGHLGFDTPDIKQAMEDLEKQGYTFDPASARYTEDGNLQLIYLTEEIDGFAIHLTTME